MSGAIDSRSNGLEFNTTTPTRPRNTIPFDLADTYLPRYMPRYFSYATEGPHVRIRDTEYWVTYANGHLAVAVLKNEGDAKKNNLPLFILVGNWFDKASKELFVGCVLLVRSYVSIVHKGIKQPIKPFVAGERGYFVKGIPEPSAAAYEWAVKYKPVLKHALGFVRDFTIERQQSIQDHYRYRIVAFDQEFNQVVFVPDEYWPLKNCPDGPGSALILTYAHVQERVSTYMHIKSNIEFLLPTYLKFLIPAESPEEKICHRFLAWIDVKFYPYPTDLRMW